MMVDNLENSIGLRLKPKNQNGQLNGWLNIQHYIGDHQIDVFIYTANDNPKHVKKPNPMPTLTQVRNNIV